MTLNTLTQAFYDFCKAWYIRTVFGHSFRSFFVPVRIVHEMIYNVLSGTLSLYTTLLEEKV